MRAEPFENLGLDVFSKFTMEDRMRIGIRASLLSALVLALALPVLAAQNPAKPTDKSTASTASADKMKSDAKTGGARSFASGQKAEIDGIILKREPDSIILRTNDGMDVKVALTNTTA